MGLSPDDIAAISQAFDDPEYAEGVASGGGMVTADLPFAFAAVRAQGRSEATESQARRIGELEAFVANVAERHHSSDHYSLAAAFERFQTRARALLPADTKEPSDDR